jgi:hypothetical protein
MSGIDVHLVLITGMAESWNARNREIPVRWRLLVGPVAFFPNAMKALHSCCLAAGLLGCGASSRTTSAPEPRPTATLSPTPSSDTAEERPKDSFVRDYREPISLAQYKGQHYLLNARATRFVPPGGSGEFNLALLAEDGYRIDDRYPYELKLTTQPADILTLERTRLGRAEGSYSDTGAWFRVRFQAVRSGEAQIHATMTLSICMNRVCVKDTVQLEVLVQINHA